MVATIQGNAARNKAVSALHAGLRDAAHAQAKLNVSLNHDQDLPEGLKFKAGLIGLKISEAMTIASITFPAGASEMPKMENDGPVALIEKAGGRVVLYVHGEVVKSVVSDQSTKSVGEVAAMEALAGRINVAERLGR